MVARVGRAVYIISKAVRWLRAIHVAGQDPSAAVACGSTSVAAVLLVRASQARGVVQLGGAFHFAKVQNLRIVSRVRSEAVVERPSAQILQVVSGRVRFTADGITRQVSTGCPVAPAAVPIPPVAARASELRNRCTVHCTSVVYSESAISNLQIEVPVGHIPALVHHLNNQILLQAIGRDPIAQAGSGRFIAIRTNSKVYRDASLSVEGRFSGEHPGASHGPIDALIGVASRAGRVRVVDIGSARTGWPTLRVRSGRAAELVVPLLSVWNACGRRSDCDGGLARLGGLRC